MLRSLSSRSAVSEIMMDDDYNSSSAMSSRNNSRVLQSFEEHPVTPTQSPRLEKMVFGSDNQTTVLNASSNGANDIVPQNQWNYLPQTVWKQTAEVKQINFD